MERVDPNALSCGASKPSVGVGLHADACRHQTHWWDSASGRVEKFVCGQARPEVALHLQFAEAGASTGPTVQNLCADRPAEFGGRTSGVGAEFFGSGFDYFVIG